VADLLVVTNGDSAAATLALALPGVDVLPWRDMLHDGPVPAGLALPELSASRAVWLADHLDLDPAETGVAFRERDARLAAVPAGAEVAVCVEHDLYDQFQLLQVLAELAPRAGEIRLTLAQADLHLGTQEPAALADLVQGRRPIEAETVAAAQEVWDAFRAPTPERLARESGRPCPGLPWLEPALRHLLEELPDPAGGVTRTERTILGALVAGPTSAGQLFATVGEREQASFLGDWPFFRRLEELAAPPGPLIEGLPGRFDTAAEPVLRQAWIASRLRLTDAGRAVLAGGRDRLADRPPDRWLGGTRLRPGNVWRWDRDGQRLSRG
jgi:hypothetical protein